MPKYNHHVYTLKQKIACKWNIRRNMKLFDIHTERRYIFLFFIFFTHHICLGKELNKFKHNVDCLNKKQFSLPVIRQIKLENTDGNQIDLWRRAENKRKNTTTALQRSSRLIIGSMLWKNLLCTYSYSTALYWHCIFFFVAEYLHIFYFFPTFLSIKTNNNCVLMLNWIYIFGCYSECGTTIALEIKFERLSK